MTAIHSFRPRAIDNSTTSKIYFIVVAVLVISFVGIRITTLRRRNQAISQFFRFNVGPYAAQPQNDTSYGSSYRPYTLSRLAPLPAALHRDRRVRAVDTDEQGRRLGPAGEDWDGKDVLPAYDGHDRLPMYVEALSQAPPHQATDQSAGDPAGEQSRAGNVHDNSTRNESQPHVNADDISRLPPVYHDSSSS